MELRRCLFVAGGGGGLTFEGGIGAFLFGGPGGGGLVCGGPGGACFIGGGGGRAFGGWGLFAGGPGGGGGGRTIVCAIAIVFRWSSNGAVFVGKEVTAFVINLIGYEFSQRHKSVLDSTE